MEGKKKRPVEVRIGMSIAGCQPPKMNGLFHQFGIDLEEQNGDFQQQTVAIVEDEKGNIHCVHPTNIKFLDKQ